MKRKILFALLIVILALCSFGLTACSNNDKDESNSGWGSLFTIETAYAKAQELGYEGTLEEFLETIKGVDGLDGENGKSAYELYKEKYGYVGTEEEWLYDLVNGNLSIVNKYQVSFNTDGGSLAPITQTIKRGHKVSKPNDPTKDGAIFDGWYYKGEKWSFVGYVVTENMTLTAKWIYESGTEGLVYEEYLGGYQVVGYTGSSTEVVVPSYYNEKTVISIGDNAFYDCDSLKSIEISNGLKSIGYDVFDGCSNLENVIIPNSVTSINTSFRGRTATLNFNEFDNALYLGNSINPYLLLVEPKDKSITSCLISSGTKFIGRKVFAGCKDLQSLSFEGNSQLIHIEEGAFHGCDNLSYNTYDNALYLGSKENPNLILVKAKNTDIFTCEINNDTRIIYEGAFDSCENLGTINIPSSVVSISYNAFSYSGLKAITFSENCQIEVIDNFVFEGSSLENITIPDSVRKINYGAFRDSNLKNIIFSGNSKLESI